MNYFNLGFSFLNKFYLLKIFTQVEMISRSEMKIKYESKPNSNLFEPIRE